MQRCVIALLVFVTISCAPGATPTPVPPTLDLRATETRIAANIFATQTASAPTATRIATLTRTPTASLTPTTSSKSVTPIKRSPTPTATPRAGPTIDPLVKEIPKGMSGVIVYNYISNQSVNFTLQGKLTIVPPNDKRLVVIAPGKYTYTLNVPGRGGWNDDIEMLADQYRWIPVYLEFR